MKNKHENIMRNIGMFTFVIIMIFMKVSGVSTQIFVGIIFCTGCIVGGVYLNYKGAKKGLKMAGAFMFCLAFAGLLVILSQYFNSYNLCIPAPACIFLGFYLGYKTIVRFGDKEIINQVKKPVIGSLIALALFQILMVLPLFIKIG
ncbi:MULTISPECIES: hypothetical protein [Clostridium]|uniref:Uncharacterized protein n=1 Tax=Clostridium frigoriphilum TaxID=443253 RepID=A0ABU7UWE2_9CLOT|nr:hypothetical protein [Clostridium sp. DSM 17811]MBU3102231.1 hypothetical protein [Clostridium sp. DSM 17811]